MITGELTPRSNDSVSVMRYTGGFGQPDGFGGVLTVTINQAGDVYFTLEYRAGDGAEHQWSVGLTNEQRRALITQLLGYEPKLFEVIQSPK